MKAISGFRLIEVEEGLLKLAARLEKPEDAELLREASSLLTRIGILLGDVRRVVEKLAD